MRHTRGLLLLSLTLALVCSAVFVTWAGRSALNPGRVAMGPEPWRPANWDVTVHSRDRTTWTQLEAAAAHHGGACEPPPATHVSSEYADAVFACRGHVMTAINASGYGVVYLTPNRQLDFSNGAATLEFDLSTLRSSTRDWVDVWLTPYDDTLQLALDGFLPDGSGEPRNAVHVRMDTFYPEGATIQTIFRVSVVRDFRVEEVPGNDWTGYERLLTPSATRRDTFRLEVGRTRVRFGMPDHDFWWV